MTRLLALAVACSVVAAGSAPAQTTNFMLTGVGGAGLLGSNQVPTPVVGGGSGGLLLGGISFDNTSHVLTINVGWGSGHAGSGFADLTGNAIAGHLHGPTLSAAPASFGESAGIAYPLDNQPGWNASASNGGFIGSITIAGTDVAALMNGQFYMNVHTASFPGGEVRGNLVPVPEPATVLGLSAVGLVGVRALRRTLTAPA
jgi:hypothetical protein